MKKKHTLLMILLVLACLLTACGNEEPVPSETAAPTETTVVTEPPETTLPPTEPPTTVPETTAPPATEPEETLPEGAEVLNQEELDALTELFTQPMMDVMAGYFPYTNWYNMAMSCHYDSPEKISFWSFFGAGLGGPESFSYEPSEEELAVIAEQQTIYTSGIERIPKGTMDAVLQEYFGISFDQTLGVDLEILAYNPANDCYYSQHGGIMYVIEFEITGGYRTAEGNVVVNYLYGVRDSTITLKPKGDGYQILSNIVNNFEDIFGASWEEMQGYESP